MTHGLHSAIRQPPHPMHISQGEGERIQGAPRNCEAFLVTGVLGEMGVAADKMGPVPAAGELRGQAGELGFLPKGNEQGARGCY